MKSLQPPYSHGKLFSGGCKAVFGQVAEAPEQLSVALKRTWTTIHPSNRADPLQMPWVAPTAWAMLGAGGGWAVVSTSCRISGRGAGNRERWTDLCWAPSVLQQIDFHHRTTFATWITSHSSLQLSGCIFASQGLASLSKKPPMCSTAASQCSTWISAPAWLTLPLPHFTEAAPFQTSGFTVPRETCASTVPLQPLLRKDGQGRKDVFTSVVTKLQAGPVPSITCMPRKRSRAWEATELGKLVSEQHVMKSCCRALANTPWPEFIAWGWHSFRHMNKDVEVWYSDIKCGPFWHCETQNGEQNHFPWLWHWAHSKELFTFSTVGIIHLTLWHFTTVQVKHTGKHLDDVPGEKSPWCIWCLMRQHRWWWRRSCDFASLATSVPGNQTHHRLCRASQPAAGRVRLTLQPGRGRTAALLSALAGSLRVPRSPCFLLALRGRSSAGCSGACFQPWVMSVMKCVLAGLTDDISWFLGMTGSFTSLR